MTPVGALGEGVGSAMASGCGWGSTGALVTVFFCSTGVGGAGGTGSTLGAGGSTNCVRISAGTTISAARINRPLCSAQINPTCSATTARAMTVLRPSGGLGRVVSDEVGLKSAVAFIGYLFGERMTAKRATGSELAAENPPRAADHQDQADGKCCNETCEVFHGLPSWAGVASLMLAVGQLALHWATTSRAQRSHWPHWVATPSSNWISSKPIPARA